MPSISLGYQAGILEKISVGGIAGYSSSSYGVIGYKWTYSYMFIGARGEYHFVDVDLENFDLYGGLTLGYNIVCFRTKRLLRLLQCWRKLPYIWFSCWRQIFFLTKFRSFFRTWIRCWLPCSRDYV